MYGWLQHQCVLQNPKYLDHMLINESTNSEILCSAENSFRVTHYYHLLEAAVVLHTVPTTCNDDRIKEGWPSWVSSVGTTIVSKQEIENPKKNAEETAKVQLMLKQNSQLHFQRAAQEDCYSDVQIWSQNTCVSGFSQETENRRAIKQKMCATRTQELVTVMRSGLFGPSPFAKTVKMKN